MQQILPRNILDYTQEDVLHILYLKFRVNCFTDHRKILDDIAFIKHYTHATFKTQLEQDPSFRQKIQKMLAYYL